MNVVCSALLLGAALASVVLANPLGGTVASGTATISTAGKTLTVNQTTDKAIINWQRFENTATETIRFQQPGATSLALNRVTGVDPSVISGALQANGRIFLMNPNGVVFGAGSRVNVGSLVASTLTISDTDFNNNNFRMVQADGAELGAVVNQGTITAQTGGLVALVAPIVSNDGAIVAPAGSVFMVGTTDGTVTLSPHNVTNNRTSTVDKGGRVPAVGVSPLLESVINTESFAPAIAPGRVERLSDGTVFLRGADGIVVNGGTIDVTGDTAGQVKLEGTYSVALGPGSLVNGGTGAVSLRTQKGAILHHRPEGGSDAQAVVRGATINADASFSQIRTQGARRLRFEGGDVKLRGGDRIGRLSDALEIVGDTLDVLSDRGEISLFVVGDITVKQVRSTLRASFLDPEFTLQFESTGSVFAGNAPSIIHLGGMRQKITIAGDAGALIPDANPDFPPRTAALVIARPTGGTQSISVGGTRFLPEFELNEAFSLNNARRGDANFASTTALDSTPVARSNFSPPVDVPDPVIVAPVTPDPVLVIAPGLPAVDNTPLPDAGSSSGGSTVGQADNVILPALRTNTVRNDAGDSSSGSSTGGIIEVVNNAGSTTELDGSTPSDQVASSSKQRDNRLAQMRRRRQSAAGRTPARR